MTLTGVLLSVSFHIPLFIGFSPGFLFLLSLIKGKGTPVREIWKVCKRGVSKTQTVILILFLVSFILPSWYEAGTINLLVSIALQIIKPDHFFLFSFLIAMLFSMTLGTSIGTLSAVGIPIMSSAISIDLAPHIVAGALLSGAFVGDRTSPFSSAFQLLSHTVEISNKKQFNALLLTTIPAILICIAFYRFLDFQYAVRLSELTTFPWKELSFIKLLPPLILIVVVLFRIGIVYAFLASIIVASIISIINGTTFYQLSHSLFFGVEGMGGGLINMYVLLLFLALAGAYNGLLEEYRVIQPLIDGWLNKSKTLVEDSVKTIISTFGISLIAANQTLPIILTGRSLLPHWKNNRTRDDLARVMADSSMLFPGMIPWSVLTIMCSTVLGLPVTTYLPFAIFLWSLPFITIVASIFKQLKLNKRRTGHVQRAS
ncbi:Na+/H+ antiporter NhaC family protein [Bacillus sp. HNG]|uniref:Na+/H+ antiporter NhaC family protein n=1 Tax=Bacillus sp. HNG TaxID=2293325 RepID=UPI001CB94835|nr:Na+/H+ antiporter NhaC family protein [Bacillus sp. HNG]